MTERPRITLLGTVDQILTAFDPGLPDKAQITLQGDHAVPQEIRIKNTLLAANGDEVALNKGAVVKVTIKA